MAEVVHYQENAGQAVKKIEGRIVTPHGVIDGFLQLENGIITELSGEPAPKNAGFHPELPTIVPSFIDLHNHGGNGGAFSTGTQDQARNAAQYHREHGTTVMLASMVSAPADALAAQVENLIPLCEEGLLCGIHLEGPFINACRCGAQNPDFIFPGNPTDLAQVIHAGKGWIKSITVAPETDNLTELLDLCAAHHIIASFGHTDADFDTTTSAIALAKEKNVTVTATHLFNAMPPLHHRDPGSVGALLAAARAGDAYVELIADGVHLADGTVDLARSNNAFFITDAMEAAGMPDGEYILGVLNVTVTDGVARLRDGGAIAGGTSTLASQFVHHVRRGMTLIDATLHTSTVAAKILGLSDHEIVKSNPVNFVVFDSNGQLQQVHLDHQVI